MRHLNCSSSIMASAGGHRVWKRSESSLNVSMWVSVWLVVKLPTQKLQRVDGLMPATHRTQSAISLTSTYVTSKAESGMNTDNFNCKSRWGSANPPQGSRQPCSTRAILWESWRGASSAVGELWEMFTLQQKKNKKKTGRSSHLIPHQIGQSEVFFASPPSTPTITSFQIVCGRQNLTWGMITDSCGAETRL